MNTRSIIAGAVAAAALLVAVPAASAATSTAPGKPGPSKHVTTAKKGWTLCASRTGKVRLATKLKPCSRWETKIPVAPVQQPQPKKDDRPAPYYLREGNTTKYCAPVGKWRGAWVVDCKVNAQKPQSSPESTPTPTETTPEPSPTATATAESADS